ncbi:nitrile hydratase subunit beta, partial [Acinetobacter baumannii]
LGGMHGLGPVLTENNEQVFHEAWEGRAFGLFAATFVCAGYTVDEFRHAIEKIAPAHYLESSYYEHWMFAFEEVLIRRGFVSRDELDSRIG